MSALLTILMISVLLLSMLTSCNSKSTEDLERLIKINLDQIFQKSMQPLVWLPEDMSEEQKYPVLYFLSDYGGSAYAVINEVMPLIDSRFPTQNFSVELEDILLLLFIHQRLKLAGRTKPKNARLLLKGLYLLKNR